MDNDEDNLVVPDFTEKIEYNHLSENVATQLNNAKLYISKVDEFFDIFSCYDTRMKRLFPKHHLHELRHTFVSRCKESGVASEVVSIWAGHSLSGTITTTVYTHYSDEFQLKEAEKVVY